MKILLIRPQNTGNINTRLPESLNKRQGVLPPLGLAYIASFLRSKGCDVRILDAIALNLTLDDLRHSIEDYHPDIVGVTAMTSTLFGALDAARIAKETGCIAVLGGPQVSAYPVETLSYPFVDYGIAGEGELPFWQLVEALNRGAAVDSVQGLVYRKNGAVHVNSPSIAADLDALPFPAFDLLPMKRYDSIIGRSPVCTMVSTRGCPYRCHFCAKQPSDRKFRCRSPHNVVDEMEFLVNRFGINEIMFYDDVITVRRAHIEGMCREILARNLKVCWESPARVDTVDASLLALMKKAGCIRLRYGIESGDERILALMNKKITVEQVREAVHLTRTAGIETFGYFMIGYATETPETIRTTISFACSLKLDMAMFTVVTPYPHTPLYEMARREAMLRDDYWREFTLGRKNGERLPYFVPDAPEWVKRAYMRFYLNWRYILRQMLRIRSIEQVWKCFRALWGIVRI